jgi:hypothetical protein
MVRRLKALYSGKTLIPQEPCDLPEGAIVELILHGAPILPPEIGEPGERARALRAVVARMQRNPLPAAAPRLTREQLHERT